jgi:predicted transcriptional regulator
MAKTKTNDRALGLRMESSIVESLERIATELDLSVSWCVRRACQQFIQRYDASKSSVVALAVEPMEDRAVKQAAFDSELDKPSERKPGKRK